MGQGTEEAGDGVEWGNVQSGVLRCGNWGAGSGWNWGLRVERRPSGVCNEGDGTKGM